MSDCTMTISRVPNFRAICFLFRKSLRFLDIICDAVGCCSIWRLCWCWCCCCCGCSWYEETALRTVSEENVLMRRALIFRRHECLGESVSSNLSLSSDSKRAMHGPPLFFRAHHGRSRLPSRSLSLEKGDGRYRAVGGARSSSGLGWRYYRRIKISFFLAIFRDTFA